MRKPNDEFTPEEEKAIETEVNRLAARLPDVPVDILRGAVIIRQAEGMLAPIYEFLGLRPPEPVYGYCYWLPQEPRVYAEIDQVAARPLSDAAHRLLAKHGLNNG